MLYQTNVLALVGGGNNPKFLTNKVVIWDASKSEAIGELKYNEIVRSVKFNKEK